MYLVTLLTIVIKQGNSRHVMIIYLFQILSVLERYLIKISLRDTWDIVLLLLCDGTAVLGHRRRAQLLPDPRPSRLPQPDLSALTSPMAIK